MLKKIRENVVADQISAYVIYEWSLREENTNSECPVCQSPNISPDDLIPSRKTRLAVQKFRNSQQLATATTAVPENNDIKKPKSIINQIIENKMPSLPDIPGITVPKGNILKLKYLIVALLPKELLNGIKLFHRI